LPESLQEMRIVAVVILVFSSSILSVNILKEAATDAITKKVADALEKMTSIGSKETKELFHDQALATAIYDQVKSKNVKLPVVLMKKVQNAAFNRFPETFYKPQAILGYSSAREEVRNLLFKSQAFQKYSQSPVRLRGLITRMRSANVKDGPWKKYLPYLDKLEAKIWVREMSLNDIGTDIRFLNYIDDEIGAITLYKALKSLDSPVSPKLLKQVQDAAFELKLEDFTAYNMGLSKRYYEYFRDNGALDVLSASKQYQAILLSPSKAKEMYEILTKGPESNARQKVTEQEALFLNNLLKASRS
jgi:hypothetical protein